MVLAFVLLFTGFGVKMHTMRDVNTQCVSSLDKGSVCNTVAKSTYVVKSTNPTILGMDD